MVALAVTDYTYEQGGQAYPTPIKTRQRAAASKVRTGFGFQPNQFVDGWEVQSWQPPAWPPARIKGAILEGHTKLDDIPPATVFVVFAQGWEVQSFQPPPKSYAREGGMLESGDGDDGDAGNYPPVITIFPEGWQVQPVQPPPINWALKAPGLKGRSEFAILSLWINAGWEVQPPQPPTFPTTVQKSIGAVTQPTDTLPMPPFIPPIFVNGWNIVLPGPEKFRPLVGADFRGDDGNYFPLAQVLAPVTSGWLASPSTDWRRPPRPDLASAFDVGGLIPAPVVWWSDPEASLRVRRALQFDPAVTFSEIGPPSAITAGAYLDQLPPFLRFKRAVQVVQVELASPPRAAVPWFERQDFLLRRRLRLTAEVEEATIAIPPPVITFGWFAPQQDIVVKRVNKLGRYIGDESINRAILPPVPRVIWGWDVRMPEIPHRRFFLDRAIEVELNFPVPFVRPFIGWDAQPWQPVHVRFERAGAGMRGEDGIEFPFISPAPEGAVMVLDDWYSTQLYPWALRSNRAGAIMQGDISGTWGPFFLPVPSGARAFDLAVYSAIAFSVGPPPPFRLH
jgi:hypothetical protein